MRFTISTFLLLATVMMQGQARPDSTLDQFAQTGVFAFGGVGFAGLTSQGEKDYQLIMARSTALADFELSASVKKRAKQITLLLMDVDGTMTDGSVTLLSQPHGSALEIKTFDAHDGQGLTLAHTAGLRTGCITGRESAALMRRGKEMKMEFIYMKQALKMPAYEEILGKAGLSDASVAFIGDDLPDIPLMRRVGLAVAVGDAVAEVKKVAHYTTKALAGHGAVREAIELVLRSKGIWEAMIDQARA